MDDLKTNPLLQPAYITKLLDEIIPDTSEYFLSTVIPMVTQETDKVIVDVRDNIGGMTQAVARHAESPLVEFRGQSQFEFAPAFFREKVVLGERDLKSIRKIGTATDFARARDRIAEVVGGLRMRLETRVEWCRWQMILGSLTISQTDVQFSVNYGIPLEMRPTLTGGDLWSAIGTADPVDDLIEWSYLYRDFGYDPEYGILTRYLQKLLLQNTKIRELAEAHFTSTGNAMMNTERLNEILKTFAGIPYKLYDKGYYLKVKLETPITPVSTSFVVSENPGIVANDTITVVHLNGSRFATAKIIVTPTGLSFAHAAIGGSITFPAGSTIQIKKRFLPDNKFIIMGRVPQGTTGGTNIGEFVSVPSAYNGNLENPVPGPFGKTVFKNDDDPPKIEVISGIYGLPVHYHPACNVVSTVA